MTAYVFLDRDNTLVRDHGYTHRIEDYELLPGVVEGLQQLVAAGFRLAVITNQSGIGRGLFSEAHYEAFRAHLDADLARSGITFDGHFCCPHHPDAGCHCRKPEPGLLERAAEQLGADLSRSWVIGDSVRDVDAAKRAGCRGAVRVLTGQEPATASDRPEATNFLAAVSYVLAEARST